MAEVTAQQQPPSLIQKLQTSPLRQKVERAIPGQITQAVKEKVERVKMVAPEMEQEARVYVEGFRLRMRHLIFLGYFLATFLWHLLQASSLPFQYSFWFLTGWNLTLWLFGGIVGWNLPILDYLVYVYFVGPGQQKTDEPRRYVGGGRHFTHPEETVAIQAKQLLARRQFTQAISFLQTKEIHLSFRGVLFRLVWVALTLFALTSTASLFGKGLLMGLGLNLLLAEWREQRANPQALNSQLFWQIKREVSSKEQQFYLWGMTGAFAVLSFLV